MISAVLVKPSHQNHIPLSREQEGGMAEFVARAQEMILDLDDPSMVIVNDEILTNFLFFQSYQVNNF